MARGITVGRAFPLYYLAVYLSVKSWSVTLYSCIRIYGCNLLQLYRNLRYCIITVWLFSTVTVWSVKAVLTHYSGSLRYGGERILLTSLGYAKGSEGAGLLRRLRRLWTSRIVRSIVGYLWLGFSGVGLGWSGWTARAVLVCCALCSVTHPHTNTTLFFGCANNFVLWLCSDVMWCECA